MRKELQQLKQEYEAKIKDLESRLAALEQQQAITKDAAKTAQQVAGKAADAATTAQQTAGKAADAATTAQQAAGKAAKDAVQALQTAQRSRPSGPPSIGTTPTYDQLRDADNRIRNLESQLRAFEFHGYLRAGYGVNGKGGQQVAFKAPGADAKYRLGNEPDTYGELIFVNNWVNSEHDSERAWLKTEVLVQGNTASSSSFDDNDKFRLREAFVEIGNVVNSQPEMTFWAGNRYYRRQDIHINDFYYLDMSGYGAGVENLDVKLGRMAVSYLGGARQDVVTDNGSLSKSNFDVRLYNVKAPQGTFRFWYNFATAKGGTRDDGIVIPTTKGHAFGIGHFRNNIFCGYNRFMVEYGTGAASNFSTAVELPTPYLKDSKTFRITEHMLIQPNKAFSIMPAIVYQRRQNGRRQDGTDTWISLGARPIFFFSNNISLALEPGFDYTKSGQGLYRGWLRKFTIAPQIGATRDFFSRPVLRAFLTYANWSDGFKGLVGGIPYRDRTSGITFGVQVETWW